MERFSEADKAVEDGQNDKNLDLMKAALEKGPADDPEILWRVARAYYLVGENTGDKEQASSLSHTAHDFAKKALAVKEDSANVQKWVAITLGRLGDFVDTTSKIKSSFLIKEHLMRAKELNPDDSTVAHVLGRWCFSVSNISFVERTAASVLFASPPTSSYEEALEHFLRHEKLMESRGGGMIRNKMYIGDCYMALSNKDEAAKFFKAASECVAKTENDRKTVAECKTKLANATAKGWW